MYLGGTMILVFPDIGTRSIDQTVNSILTLLIPLVLSSFLATIYLIHKGIFNLKNFIKYSFYPAISIVVIVLITLGTSILVGGMCGGDEACGYAAIGGFVFGPFVAIPFVGLTTAVIYKLFLKKDLAVSSNTNVSTNSVLKSKAFWAFVVIIVLIILVFLGFKGYQNFSDSNVNSWKTFEGNGYILKYPPKGQINIGDEDGGDPNSDDGDLEAIILTRSDDYPDDYGYKHIIYVTKYSNSENLSLNEWYEENGEYLLRGKELNMNYSEVNGYESISVEDDINYNVFIKKDGFVIKFEIFKQDGEDWDKIGVDYFQKITSSFN